MAKQSITNTAPGPRSINCVIAMDKDGKPIPAPVALMPGETADLEVFNTEDAVFKGLVAKGELAVGAPGTKPELPSEKLARLEGDMTEKLEAARVAGRAEAQSEIDRIQQTLNVQEAEHAAAIAKLQDDHAAEVSALTAPPAKK